MRPAAATLACLLALAGLVPASAQEVSAPAPTAEIDGFPVGPSPEARLEEIRRRVQAAVVYPERARERGIEGTARIQFQVGTDGLAREITTVESSGHALLDTAAERGAQEAGQLPSLYGWIRIPIEFALKRR